MIAGALEIQLMADTAMLARDMHEAQRTVDGTMGKIGRAIGVGFAAGWEKAKTAWESFKEWMKTQVVIWGVALAVGVTAAVVGAVYTAFKAVSFAVGLLTGESYKSANIDALVAMNKEVKTLQENLPLTATGASALNEALKQQGTSAAGYAATLGSVASASRSNGAELERLGVQYKDQNGTLLTTRATLVSVAAVLATYAEGWDRQQAAAAIGMGSEKQIQDALAITAEKVQSAKDRLIDYGLVIGEGTQEAVTKYEEAMRAFAREADLTSQGFKKAIADNVMPILTQLAEFFREGFPTVVMAFRYSMATVTSLFYGLKTAVFIVAESIVGSVSAIGSVLAGLAIAAGRALTGDFAGAKGALVQGWEEAKNRLSDIGTNIVEQARTNSDAMALAWGADSLNAKNVEEQTAKTGKAWQAAAPAAAVLTQAVEDNDSAYRSLLRGLKEKLIVERDRTEVAKLTLALEALNAKQLAAITPERKAELEDLARKVDLLKQNEKALKAYVKEEEARIALHQEAQEAIAAVAKERTDAIFATDKSIEQMKFETTLIGATNVQREQAIFLRQAEIDNIDAATIARGKDAIAAKQAAQEVEDLKKKSQSEFLTMWSTIENTGKQVFINVFSQGKNAFEGIGKAIKASVIDLLYQITARKWMIQIGASVAGSLGISTTGTALANVGGAGASGGMGMGGWLSAGQSAYSEMTGGLSSAYASMATSGAGQAMGLGTAANEMYAATVTQFGQTVGAGLSYIGAGLAGIAIGTAIAGDKTVAGIKGSTMATVGTILGSIVGGPIGGLIGGAIGGAINAAFGMGAKSAGATRLQGSFSAGGFGGGLATDWKQEGGWFRSDRSGTDFQGLQEAQYEAFKTLMAGTASVFGNLIAVAGDAPRTLAGWAFAIDRVVQSEAEQNALVIDIANSMGRKLIPELAALQQKGENLADTAVRLRDEFVATTAMAELLGKDASAAFGATGLASLKMRDQLVQLMGGLQAMSSVTQAYYMAFFSDQERQVNDLRMLTAQFRGMGQALPATKEAFRALVEAQDLSTDAGQQLFAALMRIAPAFAQVADAALAAGAAALSLTDRLAAAQKDALAGVQEMINTSRSAASTARQTADSYRQITTSLADAIMRIKGGGIAATGANLQSTFATAMTGNATALGALPRVADDFLAASLATSRTAIEFARDQAKVIGLLEQAGTVSTGLVDWNEYQATLLETQTGVLEAIRAQLELPNPDTAVLTEQTNLIATIGALLRDQTGVILTGNSVQDVIRDIAALDSTYSEEMLRALVIGATTQGDSLQGIYAASDTTVALLRQLVDLTAQGQVIKALAEQEAAAERARQQGASQAAAAYEAEKSIVGALRSARDEAVGRLGPQDAALRAEDLTTGTAGGYDYYSYRIGQEALVGAAQAANIDYMAAVARAYALYKSIPGHAGGGIASGWSMVGERGPELANFSQPARIYTADQTRGMMGGAANDDLLDEIKSLRAAVERLEKPATDTADATRKTKDELQQVTRGGLSIQTRAA